MTFTITNPLHETRAKTKTSNVPVYEKGADRISIDIDEKRLDRPYFLFPIK